MPRLPHPWSCSYFFEQSEFKGLLGDNFFQLQGLALEILTSLVVADRAVSPAKRRLPASRNSFDQLY